MNEYGNLVIFTIDDRLRRIIIPDGGDIFGVAGDIRVNRIMFKIPRYCADFDISEFTARINYVNPNGDANYFENTNLMTANNDVVSFVWEMEPDVTSYVGDVKFSVKLYKKEGQKVVKEFNTLAATGHVLEGFSVESTVTPEQQQTLLEKLEAEIKENINDYIQYSKEGLETEIKEDISKYAETVKEEVFVEVNKDAMVKQITNNKEDILKIKEKETETDKRLSIAEKQLSNLNIDNVEIKNIVLDIEAGIAPSKYPVGTQIVTDWDRVDTSGNKTSYRPELNIVHYENVPIKDAEEDVEDRNANVMYLEWDKTIPDNISFCVEQALQCFDGTEGTPNGLPAGTYAIKMKAPNGGTTFKNRWNGKYAKIVLAKPIPEGGTLRLSIDTWDGDDTSKLGLIFKTYASDNQNDEQIEAYASNEPSDTLPDGATFIGEVWGEDVGYGKLNHPEACYYGDNTWSTSDLRQWLNSEGTDWWKKLTRYNIKPISSLQGYLTGLDTDLKAHMRLIKNVTIGNNQKFSNQKFTTYDRVFLLSNNQENIESINQLQTDNEGNTWDYYKILAENVDNLNTQKMFKLWNTYPELIRYAINATIVAQNVFSRSASVHNAGNVLGVNTSGICGYFTARSGLRCLPACIIAAKH